jgi:hypothetical protein
MQAKSIFLESTLQGFVFFKDVGKTRHCTKYRVLTALRWESRLHLLIT